MNTCAMFVLREYDVLAIEYESKYVYFALDDRCRRVDEQEKRALVAYALGSGNDPHMYQARIDHVLLQPGVHHHQPLLREIYTHWSGIEHLPSALSS